MDSHNTVLVSNGNNNGNGNNASDGASTLVSDTPLEESAQEARTPCDKPVLLENDSGSPKYSGGKPYYVEAGEDPRSVSNDLEYEYVSYPVEFSGQLRIGMPRCDTTSRDPLSSSVDCGLPTALESLVADSAFEQALRADSDIDVYEGSGDNSDRHADSDSTGDLPVVCYAQEQCSDKDLGYDEEQCYEEEQRDEDDDQGSAYEQGQQYDYDYDYGDY
jgi:hypothetical protein